MTDVETEMTVRRGLHALAAEIEPGVPSLAHRTRGRRAVLVPVAAAVLAAVAAGGLWLARDDDPAPVLTLAASTTVVDAVPLDLDPVETVVDPNDPNARPLALVGLAERGVTMVVVRFADGATVTITVDGEGYWRAEIPEDTTLLGSITSIEQVRADGSVAETRTFPEDRVER